MVLETERLILRPVKTNDAQDIFEYSKEPDVGPNAGWKPHENIEETISIMNDIFIGQDYIFGMILKDSGKLIGTIGLVNDCKRANIKSRMIGYAMSSKYWGRGIMTEAVGKVLKFGFKELNLEVISAYCYPHNTRSKRVLTKCGFKFEGVLKKCEVLYNGEVRDNECYCIIKSDYEREK